MAEAKLMDHVRSRSIAAIPADLRNGVPEGVRLSGAPLLWAAGIDGAGVTIANIDTGVDATHPDLRYCPDGRVKIISFRDYVRGDGLMQPGDRAYDDNGHGTHTAGTQAAWGEVTGVAPGAQIRVYKVLDGGGGGGYDAVRRAIRDAAADGCRVLSLSLGASKPVLEWEEAIVRAVNLGCLVIVAAGNAGAGSMLWPAGYGDVISVGAVAIDDDGRMATAYFSTTNPEVDLAAHGYKVLSTMPGGGYAHMSGTSMAAPHESGRAALMLQLGQHRLGRPMSEPAAWEGLKTRSVPFGATIEQAGAGFGTFYTSLPRRLTVQVTIGKAARWVDGRMESLDVAPVLLDRRAFTPVRHTHEPMGDTVGWNDATSTVTIARRTLDGMEV